MRSSETDSAATLEAPVRAWVEDRIGTLHFVRESGWGGGPNRVWWVKTPSGEAMLKQYAEHRKLEQERRAYREWTEGLGESVARWIDDSDALCLGLMTRLEIHPSPSLTGTELHRRAGALLARFHGQPFEDRDAMDLGEAIALRAAQWRARAAGILSTHDLAWADERLGDLRDFASFRRVPCHRDYTPRNWLVLASGDVAVIDFEHTRPDLSLWDFAKLWSAEWRRAPALEGAFFEGYGAPLTADERELMGRLAVISTLGTLVWATEHRDEPFLRQGWDDWSRLRSG